jgi:signal transduction histidine kinase
VEAPGEVSGALVHDAAALEDRALLDAVVAAVRLAVARLRLAADAAAQAEELAVSRRRLVEAGAQQRTRFAVDVREGPDADLGRASDLLVSAEGAATGEVADLLRAATKELAGVRADLATVVGSDAGRVVAEGDLESALTRLAERSGAGADLRLRDCPAVPGDVATAAWFCASEAIANALKHAGGARIWLAAGHRDGRLVLDVRDDGPGGADDAGAGVIGLRERAAALGGVVRIESPRGGGTHVRVELPTVQSTLRQGAATNSTRSESPLTLNQRRRSRKSS